MRKILILRKAWVSLGRFSRNSQWLREFFWAFLHGILSKWDKKMYKIRGNAIKAHKWSAVLPGSTFTKLRNSQWHCIAISISHFSHIHEQIWKAEVEINLSPKYRSSDRVHLHETRACWASFLQKQFHENLTNGSVADTRSQADERTLSPHRLFFITLWGAPKMGLYPSCT